VRGWPRRGITGDTILGTSKPELNRVKATFHLNPEQVVTLEELRLKHFKETGPKVDKSELVRRAIDSLAKE